MAGQTLEHGFWAATLPPCAESVPAARHFTEDALRGLGVPHAAEPATLLVSELATNAVIHAGTRLRLTVLCTSGVVRIEVGDDDPTPVREVTPDPLQPRGRGIMLVDTLAANWGVNGDERGKTVWFELRA